MSMRRTCPNKSKELSRRFSMLQLHVLNEDNFSDFLALLRERGEVPEFYYRWKYLEQPSLGKPTGFVAYLGDRPVGCIGIVNRMYVMPDGGIRLATWFADWFVNEKARGQGVGLRLMKQVSKVSDYSFGIPGPEKAQEIVRKAGYEVTRYYDYYFLIRPIKYASRKFWKDSILMSVIRRLYFLRFGTATFYSRSGMFRELSSHALQLRLLEVAKKKPESFVLSDEFAAWFANMAKLPNGKKSYWELVTDKGDVVFGFNEVDNYGLVRSTLLLSGSDKVGRKLVKSMLAWMRKIGADYLVACLEGQNDELRGLPCYRIEPVPVATLGKSRLSFCAIDRESMWYSQQKFK